MAQSQVQRAYQNGATAGTQLYTCPANTTNYLHKCRLIATGANSNATIYDNTSATGTPLCVLVAPTGWPDESDQYGSMSFSKGLYIVVNGASAQLLVTFE